ncbi:hypothetical protein LCGC14_1773210 [marine sediment metagenome]|uniref:Uncharacterized protein n=1 Tax=marine sediment metagenome TaxID=412755 RepID=A0A0F9JCI5_9ZZZZ
MKLTEAERAILTALGEVWNDYCKLPDRRHANDRDFIRSIHEAQRIVGIRVARRVDPDFWSKP